jgi:molybdopterin-containing oxidoreductase family iron-sulfur binding subunit
MEKCTYCVQRIETAKIASKNAGRVPIEDGSFTTACAQACPTDAIVFGDLADPNSRVSKLHKQKRKYFLLAELHNAPRNVFLARITNPNDKLAPAAETKDDGH